MTKTAPQTYSQRLKAMSWEDKIICVGFGLLVFASLNIIGWIWTIAWFGLLCIIVGCVASAATADRRPTSGD